jgi:hypothetical protein
MENRKLTEILRRIGEAGKLEEIVSKDCPRLKANSGKPLAKLA